MSVALRCCRADFSDATLGGALGLAASVLSLPLCCYVSGVLTLTSKGDLMDMAGGGWIERRKEEKTKRMRSEAGASSLPAETNEAEERKG